MRTLFILLIISMTTFADSAKERIISLAPSITDTLYTLELEDRLVGVTDYCPQPKSGKKLPSVGSMNPPLEAMISLRPDLVITMHTDKRTIGQLRKAQIETLTIDNSSLDKIFKTYLDIGKRCNAEKQALELNKDTKITFVELVKKHSKNKTIESLVVISRLSSSPGKIAPWVAGKNSFYGQILSKFNSPSAAIGEKSFYQMSTEELLKSDPEIIIVLSPKELSKKEQEAEIKSWSKLPHLTAVRNKKIYFIGNSHIMIPGPKLKLSMLDISKVIEQARK